MIAKRERAKRVAYRFGVSITPDAQNFVVVAPLIGNSSDPTSFRGIQRPQRVCQVLRTSLRILPPQMSRLAGPCGKIGIERRAGFLEQSLKHFGSFAGELHVALAERFVCLAQCRWFF